MPVCELHYFSDALGMATSANVILPDPKLPGPYPVMFLLHGLSDDHTAWVRRTSLERYVEGLPLIVVMPSGGRGFYTDAVEGFAYEKAIAYELVDLVRHYFPTRPGWSISGLSMGGYGAARLALRRPDVFRSAHSMSGAMGFAHWPPRDDDWGREFARVAGREPTGGKDDLYALAEQVDRAQLPALRIDCGRDDFLIDANRDFHAHLESRGIPHEYEEFEGAHTWEYWDEHVRDGLAFHRRNLGF